jgi:hypothetical protein
MSGLLADSLHPIDEPSIPNLLLSCNAVPGDSLIRLPKASVCASVFRGTGIGSLAPVDCTTRRGYHHIVRMLMYFLSRVLILLSLVWALRLLWRLLAGGKEAARPPRFSRTKPQAKTIAGELRQDPNCGTYVSDQISLKSRVGDRELHFCSRKCQEEFLSAGRTVPE